MTNKGYDMLGGKGAYSYIVFIDGDLYVVEDNVGTTLQEETNASISLQGALNRLTEGGELFVASGDYPCPTGLSCNYSGITISSESPLKARIYANTAMSTLLTIHEDAQSIILKNIRFDGNDATATYTINASRTSGSSPKPLIISNCLITGANSINLIVSDREEIIIKSTYIGGWSTTHADYNIYSSNMYGWLLLTDRTVCSYVNQCSIYYAGTRIIMSNSEVHTNAAANCQLALIGNSWASISNCWFETNDVWAIAGAKVGANSPILSIKNNHFLSGITGHFRYIDLGGDYFAAQDAGLGVNIINVAEVLQSIRGSAHLSSQGVNIVSGNYSLWDYSTETLFDNYP